MYDFTGVVLGTGQLAVLAVLGNRRGRASDASQMEEGTARRCDCWFGTPLAGDAEAEVRCKGYRATWPPRYPCSSQRAHER